jgi:hypothetical protein
MVMLDENQGGGHNGSVYGGAGSDSGNSIQFPAAAPAHVVAAMGAMAKYMDGVIDSGLITLPECMGIVKAIYEHMAALSKKVTRVELGAKILCGVGHPTADVLGPFRKDGYALIRIASGSRVPPEGTDRQALSEALAYTLCAYEILRESQTILKERPYQPHEGMVAEGLEEPIMLMQARAEALGIDIPEFEDGDPSSVLEKLYEEDEDGPLHALMTPNNGWLAFI